MSNSLSVEGALASLRATEVVAGDRSRYYLHEHGDYLIARKGRRDFISRAAIRIIIDSLSVIYDKAASGDRNLVVKVAFFASRTTLFLKSNGGDKALAIVQKIIKLAPRFALDKVFDGVEEGSVARNIDGVKEALEYIRLIPSDNYSTWYHEARLVSGAIKWISPAALVNGLHGDTVLTGSVFSDICSWLATEKLRFGIGTARVLPSIEEAEGIVLEAIAGGSMGQYTQTGHYQFVELDMHDWFDPSKGSIMHRYVERVPEIILKAILARVKKLAGVAEGSHVPLVVKVKGISFDGLIPSQEKSYRALITHLVTEVAHLAYIEWKGVGLGDELRYAHDGVLHAIYDYHRTHRETSRALSS